MNHGPMGPCACEQGAEKCTPVGLCTAQEMVADAVQPLQEEIERLTAGNKPGEWSNGLPQNLMIYQSTTSPNGAWDVLRVMHGYIFTRRAPPNPPAVDVDWSPVSSVFVPRA